MIIKKQIYKKYAYKGRDLTNSVLKLLICVVNFFIIINKWIGLYDLCSK